MSSVTGLSEKGLCLRFIFFFTKIISDNERHFDHQNLNFPVNPKSI